MQLIPPRSRGVSPCTDDAQCITDRQVRRKCNADDVRKTVVENVGKKYAKNENDGRNIRQKGTPILLWSQCPFYNFAPTLRMPCPNITSLNTGNSSHYDA